MKALWINIAIIGMLVGVKLAFFPCHETAPTFIRGHIEIPGTKKIYLYSYANAFEKCLGIKSATDSSLVDQKGNYLFTIKGRGYTLFDLKNENRFLTSNLFFSPEDNITLNFLETDKTEVILKEEGGRYNDYLMKFTETFYNNPQEKNFYSIKSNDLDVDQYEIYINKRREGQLAFYRNYFKDRHPQKKFADLALAEINYQNAIDKIMYVRKKRLKNSPVSPGPHYFDFATKKFIENPRALNSPAYFRFLNIYIDNMYEHLLVNAPLKDTSEVLVPEVEKYKLAGKHLTCKVRKIVQLNIVLNKKNLVASEKLSVAKVDSLLKKFRQEHALADNL